MVCSFAKESISTPVSDVPAIAAKMAFRLSVVTPVSPAAVKSATERPGLVGTG